MPTLRLALLDVDGTLKLAESPYQYLHLELGVAHLAEENRHLALAGKISYGEWLRRDAALWAGQPVALVKALLAENPYLPGAPEFLRSLKAAGVTVALVSAGFTLNTDPIMEEFGLDYALANELSITADILDGTAVNLVPEGGKAAFACTLRQRLGISLDETLAVGDTQGDLELFDCAGVCIAVNPQSDALRNRAHLVLEHGLDGAVAWLVRNGHLPQVGR